MSGIVGVYYRDGRPGNRAAVDRMTEQLTERGPDAGGTWRDGSVGFGHRMLWTTPESLTEQQPLVHRAAQLAITADARIDNRAELIRRLRLEQAEELSDSELILLAYEQWGEECLQHLIGDFAFAIWDGRRRRLFCARDPMGVKPFVYYATPQLFAFGSAVAPLLCLSDVPRRLNETAVLDYLALLFEDKESTFYQDIFHLPPAHCITVTETQVHMRRYWALEPERELRLPSAEAYAEALREVFTEAVRCRLRSAYPVGSMLSGGLDSSSIVAVARQVLQQRASGERLHTYSAVFPTLAADYPKIDEQPWMRAVVAQGGLKPHFVAADRVSIIDSAIWWQDDPVSHPNLYLEKVIFEAARRDNVRVIMSGYDGDTAIGYGLGYLAELTRRGRWLRLHREINGLVERRGWPYRRLLWRYALHPQLPLRLRHIYRKMRGTDTPRMPFDMPIASAFAERLHLEERLRQLQVDEYPPPVTEAKNQWFSLDSGFMQFGLKLLRRAAAHATVECRLPFMDRRLLELAVAIPAAQKLHDGIDRVVMRRAMQDLLPHEVQSRFLKQDISANIRRGLFELDRPVLDDVIVRCPATVAAYADIPALQTTYRRFRSRPMQAGTADVFALFHATTLALWLRRAQFLS